MTVKDQVTKLALAAAGRVADNPAALMALDADMDAAITELRTARRDLQRRALELWPKERDFRLVVDHVGVFEKGWTGARYKWENRPLGLATVAASMDRIEHPNDVVDVLLKPAAVDRWRQGDLDELGVPWEQYRTTVTPGHFALVKARA